MSDLTPRQRLEKAIAEEEQDHPGSPLLPHLKKQLTGMTMEASRPAAMERMQVMFRQDKPLKKRTPKKA
jgi:septum formation topological specificity factor MinE